MCRNFYIGFVNFMLKSTSLLDYTNLLSANEYKKNDKIILKYFWSLKKVKMKKIYCVKCKKHRKIKNSEMSYLFYKTLVISIIYGKCGSKEKIIFKEEESIEILKTLGFIENL